MRGLVSWGIEHLPCRSGFDDAALVHEHHPVGDVAGESDFMGDHHMVMVSTRASPTSSSCIPPPAIGGRAISRTYISAFVVVDPAGQPVRLRYR
jgi:hypothetical protein